MVEFGFALTADETTIAARAGRRGGVGLVGVNILIKMCVIVAMALDLANV